MNRYTTRILKCLVIDCLEMFHAESDLNAHLQQSHGVLVHRCYLDECGLSFAHWSLLDSHLSTVHADKTSFPCGSCNKLFKTFNTLTTHTIQTHHEGLFACSTKPCTFLGTTRIDVMKHQALEHRPYTCYERGCSKTFMDTYSRRRHEMKFHCSSQVIYSCEFCLTENRNKGWILRHIERFHLKDLDDDPNLYVREQQQQQH